MVGRHTGPNPERGRHASQMLTHHCVARCLTLDWIAVLNIGLQLIGSCF